MFQVAFHLILLLDHNNLSAHMQDLHVKTLSLHDINQCWDAIQLAAFSWNNDDPIEKKE